MRFVKIILFSLSALALIGAGFVVAKLDSRIKIKAMFAAQACDNIPCFYLGIRRRAIESVIAQRGKVPSYLAIGDSITEFADLPTVCGRQPINAGIAGATTATFKDEAARLAGLANPDFIIVALGANDALSDRFDGFRDRYRALLHSLEPRRVIAIPVPPSSKIPDVERFNHEITLAARESAALLNQIETMPDGVHLEAPGYANWKESIIKASQAAVCN